MEADTDILLSIAEVAVAFAGFAALASLIGQLDHPAARHDFERLRTVVVIAILVVIAAFIPILISRFGVSDATTWRASSAVLLVINWISLVRVFRAGQESGLHRADRTYTWLGYGLEVPAELALLANVFAVAPANADALYLTFLVISFCQAGLAFLLLLASIFERSRAE